MTTTGAGRAAAARRHARRVARHPRSLATAAARVGLAARGVVYLVLTFLAADIATRGNAPVPANGEGALVEVARQPAGPFLLGLLAVGLIAYCLWRLVLGLSGRTSSERASGWQRFGSLVIAVLYALLFSEAVSLLAGSGSGTGGPSSRPSPFVARVLRWPAGAELIGLVAAGLVIGGVALAVWACVHDFDRTLEVGRMGTVIRRVARVSGLVGDVVRGALIALLGAFLLDAAVTDDPVKAKSLGQALQTFARQPYGPLVIGLAALGLAAFAVFSFIEAGYRRV